jgi:hypothetical protein
MYEGEVRRDYHNSLEFSHGMEYVLDPIGSSLTAALRSTGRQAIRLDGNLSVPRMHRVQVGPHNEIRSKSPRASAQSALLLIKNSKFRCGPFPIFFTNGILGVQDMEQDGEDSKYV